MASFGDGAKVTGAGIPCPYGLPSEQVVRAFMADACPGAEYERAMTDGWRRSGKLFYRNCCSRGCDACIPIRIDARSVAPSKTQRRAIRLNADLSISASPAAYTDEDYALFRKYLEARHPEDASLFDRAAYRQAYVDSPVETLILRYRLPGGRLAAISFLDVLPGGFSSVYFAFDPDESRRSLGTWSVFAEAALLRSFGKRWYYLGFWVGECGKMAYKAGFRPHEIAKDGEWICCTNLR